MSLVCSSSTLSPMSLTTCDDNVGKHVVILVRFCFKGACLDFDDTDSTNMRQSWYENRRAIDLRPAARLATCAWSQWSAAGAGCSCSAPARMPRGGHRRQQILVIIMSRVGLCKADSGLAARSPQCPNPYILASSRNVWIRDRTSLETGRCAWKPGLHITMTMALPTTERLLWHCGEHTAKPNIGVWTPIAYCQTLLFSRTWVRVRVREQAARGQAS